MLKSLLVLSVIFTAPAAWATDWEFIEKDNYATLVAGDEHFFLGCYPDGISMEYANAKEMKCDPMGCHADVDYDGGKTKPISLIMDAGTLSLYQSHSDAPTIPLGFLDMSKYKGADDQEELGSFARTKKIQLVFPAISRTATFDDIKNGKELIPFFKNCVREAENFQKQQAELRKQEEALKQERESQKQGTAQ